MNLKQSCAIETIKAQCRGFESKGFETICSFQTNGLDTHGKVVITKKLKAWHFADPDLNVIISQICTFHYNLEKREHRLDSLIKIIKDVYGKV